MTIMMDWTIPLLMVMITEIMMMTVTQAGIGYVTVYLNLSSMWVFTNLTVDLHTLFMQSLFILFTSYVLLYSFVMIVVSFLRVFVHLFQGFANVCTCISLLV